jgi:hypothetical protein
MAFFCPTPDSDLFNGKQLKKIRVNLSSQAAPNFHVRSGLIRESPIRVSETPSTFYPLAQRNAFGGRDARLRSEIARPRCRTQIALESFLIAGQ